MTISPIIEMSHVSKRFAGTEALTDVSLAVQATEVLCLLGDNGAGKSTLIKILSGVYQPTEGEIFVDGKLVRLQTPRDARTLGIATVHQSGGMIPLISVARNFFLGAEPTKGWGLFRRFDSELANSVSLEEIRTLGLRRIRAGTQLVGSLSGGEQQGIAIARAMYFGARILILDEPTSALGVKEAAVVLRLIAQARDRGAGVIFITHNASHALSIGDRFAVLIHGAIAATFGRGERTRQEVIDLMAGGEELEDLELELAGRRGTDGTTATPIAHACSSQRLTEKQQRTMGAVNETANQESAH
jgi:simple sugar transport system ATP-binding protein